MLEIFRLFDTWSECAFVKDASHKKFFSIGSLSTGHGIVGHLAVSRGVPRCRVSAENLQAATVTRFKMTISDFRKKKLLYVFNVFFDVNRSGTIEKKDFEIAVDRICEVRCWSTGSAEHQRTKDILMSVWDGLRLRADSNQDGQVSHEEWCSMWDEYAQNADQPVEWQRRYMEFMFDLEDTSGDGSIDEEEFTMVCSSYGATESECGDAFKLISKNKQVLVTKEVFAQLWKEYFTSEDCKAAGNGIFGKTTFD